MQYYTRLLPAAVMNTEYRANKRLYEFTGKKKEQRNVNRASRENSEEEGKRETEEEKRREKGGERERREDREDEDACREARRKIASAPTGILTFNNKARESRVVTL